MLADGCFDPLHYGHIRYLQEAAKLGSPLIVRVAPDADIIAKGRQPFQAIDERAMTVLAIGVVDMVHLHLKTQDLAGAIYELHPKYLVKGKDWKGRLPEDVLSACQTMLTEIVYVDTEERSSTERLSA